MGDKHALVDLWRLVEADYRLAVEVLGHVRHQAVLPERDHEVLGLEQEAVEVRTVDANRLTQLQLAELCGVGLRFVSELERGKPSLRLETVDKALAAFGRRLGVVEARRSVTDGVA